MFIQILFVLYAKAGGQYSLMQKKTIFKNADTAKEKVTFGQEISVMYARA